MTVSVVIPSYNEDRVIAKCISSLVTQTKKCEIIVVDDGSTDKTQSILSEIQIPNFKFQILKQVHHGPGAARNRGVKESNGEILVFVDSDMTFAPDFIEKLIKPIELGESKGTFTKEECVVNWGNIWARCWNFNLNLTDNRRIPNNYPDTAPVFRAILKKEFLRVGGFTEGVGWTDDWSLAKKLGYQSSATNAICYHANPETLFEAFNQARWIGKNEFLSKSFVHIAFNTLKYSLPISVFVGFIIAARQIVLPVYSFKEA